MVFRRGPRLSLTLLALALLGASAQWYKHPPRPGYYAVGRAAGLLMSVERSPYLRRRHLDGAARGQGRPSEPATEAASGPQRTRARDPTAWGAAGLKPLLRIGFPRRGERDPSGRPTAAAARSNSRPSIWAAGRDPWAARRPPRLPEGKPRRSPDLAPSRMERAMRKSLQLRREAARPFAA